MEGIRELAPDYFSRSLRVQFNPDRLDADAIRDRLRQIGFPAKTTELGIVSSEDRASALRLKATTAAGGIVLLAAIVVWFTHGESVWVPWLAVASTMLSGWTVAFAALRAVRLVRLDMNALMTIAAIGALAIGQWIEAPTAMFLFGASLWLERFSMGRARRAVQTLVQLTPPLAHRINAPAAQAGREQSPASHDGDIAATAYDVTDVDPAQLDVGQRVLIKPGERLPFDGRVVAGNSSVNEAPITGESMPVEKTAGDNVFAGSLNGEGSLDVRVKRTADHSTLAHVARLVAQAQASRSPTERFVDKFARYYTPLVILLAVCVAFVPPLLAPSGAEWAEVKEWFIRGLVLLVIACPCALVISTPITIVCGLHQATRYGILIKGGQFLEAAGRVDCVAMDKTGTLTTGQARVVRIAPTGRYSEEDVLRVAAALEANSEHPLAAAIVREADGRGLQWQGATDFMAIRGFGVQGNLAGERYVVASPRYFQDRGLAGGGLPGDPSNADDHLTVALVGTAQHLAGTIYLADEPRPDAADAVAQLKRLGVSNVVMLTGDRQAVADHVAAAIGIDEVHAELLPEDKVALVHGLSDRYRHLAMVGDGVNDAPALTASGMGIALGAQASDTALETADVVIMSLHLSRLGQLLRLGRRTRRLLSQNIFLALAIKATVLVLGIAGLATMWMAVAADVGASMLVIFNGMRLLSPPDH